MHGQHSRLRGVEGTVGGLSGRECFPVSAHSRKVDNDDSPEDSE